MNPFYTNREILSTQMNILYFHIEFGYPYLNTLVSSSPIIQDSKLVGAVTHAIVSNSTDGYGIFIDNTLNVSKSRGELPAV